MKRHDIIKIAPKSPETRLKGIREQLYLLLTLKKKPAENPAMPAAVG